MDLISWGLVLAVSLMSGVTGAFLYSHRAALRLAVAPYWLQLQRRLQALRLRPTRAQFAPTPPCRRRSPEDMVVLIPDGRPWPLGAALQLLELAWRWQVVHGANLPLRARQGEGAYVWRPPLPARTSADQRGVEVERP
jgi:hypothetical protein